MADPIDLSPIRRAAQKAERRMRLGRVLEVVPSASTIGVVWVGFILALHKVMPEQLPERWVWLVLAGVVLGLVATVAWAALRRLPPRAGVLALDRHHDLSGRLTNALEFAEVADDERSPFMEAAMEDARERADELSVAASVRLLFPRELGVTLVAVGAVVLIGMFEIRTERVIPPPPRQVAIDALDVAQDDLDLFQQAVDQIDEKDQDPEVKEAIEKFNQLLEDMAARRLNREEAFRKMQEIENDLLKGAAADKKAMEEALAQTAKELAKSELTKPTSDALEKKDLEQTKKELQKLANDLRSENKPSKAELERLRKALDRAAKNKQKALDALAEQRAEMQQDLLKRKKQLKKNPPKDKQEREKEERLLKKKKRQLDRLNRDIERKQRAQRRLSRLDRSLAKAAADLARELGLSAQDLEKAIEDINQLQRDQMSDQQKEELRKRLQELRDLIRQQGQGGQKMQKRLRDFLKRARGQRGGQRRPGKGQRGGQMRPGEGGQQPGQQPGQGPGQQPGEGPGQGKPGGLTLGPGGTPLPVEMPGGGSGQGDQPGGDGPGQGGDQAGHGAGGDPKGDKTDLPGAKTNDVRADAVDTGQGPTNAEVILSAAERGFKGRGYQKVYKQYRTVAEDQIDTENIPDGMRFYVRRYFQLIRPRE